MSNLLSSLAYIKARVDIGLTVWDGLVDLMLNIIHQVDIIEISSESFCSAFLDVYDIKIPLHPMNTIIGKIKQKGMIEVVNGNWILKRNLIKEISIKTSNEERFDRIILELQTFIKKRFNVDKSLIETERMFIGFLNEYDSDIYLSLETEILLPDIKLSSQDEYTVNAFIEDLINTRSSMLLIINDIVLANIHLNSIFFVDSTRKIKLNRVFAYLDTRLILRLSGIEGEFRQQEYEKLVDILFQNKCNLRIFDIHFQEVENILTDCVKWLENPKHYNPKYASKALRYFVDHNCSVSDVLLCKAQLDQIQKKYKIGIDTHNYDAAELNQYNIDENELHSIINDMYSRNGNHFENHNADEMIWNDVKAISSIYRKRKGFRANQLENVYAVLITNNRSLSLAVREYNRRHYSSQKYSECVTDTYWGTAIWLNTAYSEVSFFNRKIIADCIAKTQINHKLKARYLENLEQKKKANEINESEYYFLKEYDKAYDFIKDSTYNTESEYTDSLTEELIEIFEDEVTKPLNEIIKKQEVIVNEKNEQIEKHLQIQEKQQKKIDDQAKITSRVSMICFALIVNIPSIILLFADFIPNNTAKVIFRIVSFVIGLVISIDGFTRISFGKRIYQKTKAKLLKEWNLS